MENNNEALIPNNVCKFETIVKDVCKSESIRYPNSGISVETVHNYTRFKNGQSFEPLIVLKISSDRIVIKSDIKYSLLKELHDGLSQYHDETMPDQVAIDTIIHKAIIYVMLCNKYDLKYSGLYYTSLNYNKITTQREKEISYIMKMEEAEEDFRQKHKILAKIKDFLNL